MNEHRTEGLDLASVQDANKSWWTTNTMSYDWKDKVGLERYSLPWYDEIDARFQHGARLFLENGSWEALLPLSTLRGKRVLEIGCGMGMHTELLVRAGALLTSIDISPESNAATKRRLELKGLEAEVLELDAEKMPFASGTFDFVWSWGVIHHSSSTGRIVRQIARVLKNDGQCRVMVYNRDSTASLLGIVLDQVVKGGFLRGHTIEESLYGMSDGFTARFYPREQFEDLFRAFFSQVSCMVCGQDADVMPLPRQLRRLALKLVPEQKQRALQARFGAFLFLRAAEPVR
jgi:SAM-dependent methyltransferase